jgi:hypothetical protein
MRNFNHWVLILPPKVGRYAMKYICININVNIYIYMCIYLRRFVATLCRDLIRACAIQFLWHQSNFSFSPWQALHSNKAPINISGSDKWPLSRRLREKNPYLTILLYSSDDDDDVYLEYYSGKGFHTNWSVYMSYVKHINSSNEA